MEPFEPTDTIEQILAKVEQIFIETFDVPPERARAHVLRWKAEQMLTEADLLKSLAAVLPPEQAAKLLNEHGQACNELADELEAVTKPTP